MARPLRPSLSRAGTGSIDASIAQKLAVTLRSGPPDCQIIIPEAGGPLYFCRLQIGNIGNRQAKNVEVRMTRLRRVEGASLTNDSSFVPMSLVWSFRGGQAPVPVGGTVLPHIAPNLPHLVDLFCIKSAEPTTMMFWTELQPTRVAGAGLPNGKSPGCYRVHLAVGAEGLDTAYRELNIRFTGDWSDDVITMATKNAHVELLTN